MSLRATLFFSIVIAIFVFAWHIQSALLLNVDVSWLLEASKRMLAGGTYSNDFFENNPPWILYFYAPAVLASKLFSITIIKALYGYVFLLAAISLSLSYLLLKKIFRREDFYLANLILLALVIGMLIIPMMDFAQRENLLFILLTPYLWLMTLRLQNQPVKCLTGVIVGFLASSALLIKPYFLLPFLFIELYYIIRQKKWTFWLRPEIYAMICLGFLYLAILFTRHTDYLTTVVPIAVRWCYLGTRVPWVFVINNPLVIDAFFLPLLFYLATYEINRYPVLTKVLLLALTGFFGSYLIQQEDWRYHLLPTTSLSLCLSTLLLCLYVTAARIKRYIHILVGAFIIIMLFALRKINIIILYYSILHPVTFYCYLGGIILMLAYIITAQQRIIPIKKILFALLLGGVLFLVKYYDVIIRFDYFAEKKANLNKLIHYLDQHAAGKSVYFFTTNIAYVFPVMTYTKNTESASRFSFFWFLPGMIKQTYLPMSPAEKTQLNNDKNFLIDKVVEDFQLHQPALVFIDRAQRKNNLTLMNDSSGVKYLKFNYLDYLNTHAHFNTLWKNYHYLTTLSASFKYPINPFLYHVVPSYQHIPIAKEMLWQTVYIYINKAGALEVALLDGYGMLQRITMCEQDMKKFTAVKKILLSPGTRLDRKNRLMLFMWLAHQNLVFPFYQLDVFAKRYS